jgi:hypothetical protein
MSSDYLTFVRRFNFGLVCTVGCPNKPPESPELFGFTYHWTRRPKRRRVNEYRQFMLCTAQTLTDKWGRSILYAIGTNHDRTEFWRVSPSVLAELVATTNIGLR